MLEDENENDPSKTSGSSEPQTVHIFVGGLRRPSKKQNDEPAPAPEKPSAHAEG
jgi:hypothetical protein